MDTKNYHRMLRYPEAAEFLGISPLTLRKKVSERRVPHLKPFGPHGPVLFDPADLRVFLDKSRIDPISRCGNRRGA